MNIAFCGRNVPNGSLRIGTAVKTVMTALTMICGAFAASAVVARDRPGTPTDVRAWECHDQRSQAMHVCVEFRNTADERVNFWIEWKVNGSPMNLYEQWTDCIPSSMQGYYCLNKYKNVWNPGAQPDQTEHPFAFRVRDLEYGTEYCFRLMAVRDDQVISELWSGWACVTTPPLPAKPMPPEAPRVTLLEGSSGAGRIGDDIPDSLLIEWRSSSRGGPDPRSFEVQALDGFDGKPRGSVLESVQAGRQGNYEIAHRLPSQSRDRRYSIRVCAINIAGRACSPTASTIGSLIGASGNPSKRVRAIPPALSTEPNEPLSSQVLSPQANERLSSPTPQYRSLGKVRPKALGKLRPNPSVVDPPICQRARAARGKFNAATQAALDTQCRNAGGTPE